MKQNPSKTDLFYFGKGGFSFIALHRRGNTMKEVGKQEMSVHGTCFSICKLITLSACILHMPKRAL